MFWLRLAIAFAAPTAVLAAVSSLGPRPGRHARGRGRRPVPLGGSRRRFVLVDVVLTALTVGLAYVSQPPGALPPPPGPPGADQAIEAALARMSTEEKAGQLLVVGFVGQDVSAETKALIAEQHVGGLILFANNLRDKAQVAALTTGLQAAAGQTGSPGLLLAAMDQEGGVVARLTEREGVTVFPGNMPLGAATVGAEAAQGTAKGLAAGEDLAYRAALVTGSELKALGLNFDLAPVVDVNNNPANPVIGVRSFGEDPDLVARLGVATIRGLREAGVAAAAKHFPGHGDTSTDSHIALPSVPWGLDRLNQIELVPFRQAIAAGVDAVLVAHVTFPALESRPGVPASLSSAVLDGLLRRDLGFQGVIITDAIEMKAVADRFTVPQIVEMALGGGADIVLVGQDVPRAREAYSAIVAAVNEGRLSRQDLDAKVRRVLRLKARLGLLPETGVTAGGTAGSTAGRTAPGGAAPAAASGAGPVAAASTPADLASVGSQANRQVALEVARASVTLVRDKAALLPLRPAAADTLVLIVPELLRLGPGDPLPVGAQLGAATTLGAYLRPRHAKLTEFIYPTVPGSADTDRAAAAARGGTTVIIATAGARITPGQASLVSAVLATGKPVVWVSLWSPYDLSAVPEAPTFVAAYSFRHVTLEALAEALFGEMPFRGRLPVTVP